MLQRMARPNSKEVASAAGVSTQTFSRVIEATEYKLSSPINRIEQVVYSAPIKKLSLFIKYNIRPIFQVLLSRHVGGIICAVPEVDKNHSWIHDAALDIENIEIVGFGNRVESAFFSLALATI